MKSVQVYFIPTPVGNLEDWTFRAVRILREEVDILLAEDTRRTRILLQHYQIPIPSGGIHSFHKHNEGRRLRQVLQWLQQGKTLALLTDAGTPALADPGYLLIRLCLEHRIRYTVLPGPTSILPALLLSGFPPDRFLFAGYVPRKKRQRFLALLKHAEAEEIPVVCLEGISRLIRTLTFLQQYIPHWQVAVVREISKVHEETIRGSFSEVLARLMEHPPRGECVLVLYPGSESASGQKTADEVHNRG